MRKKSKKRIWIPVLLLILFCGICAGPSKEQAADVPIKEQTQNVGVKTEAPSDAESSPTVSVSEPLETDALSELAIHFIDVGQGDATLITCNNEAMLIDAGDNDQGTKIQNYLQKQGISELKYVICTHPDADHIGGMDVILYKFDCETIFMTEEAKDTATYRDVMDTMARKGCRATLPVVGNKYALGDAEFTIIGPAEISGDSNNNSIAIILTHGQNRFVFTGDAEEEEEQALINSGIPLDADVYKVGHHGSRTSSSEDLLDAISPTYAVISCAEGNSYGHPHAETLNALRAMDVKVFRTDEQGSIVVTDNGAELTWNCSPSDTWQAGEPTVSPATRSEDENKPTMSFATRSEGENIEVSSSMEAEESVVEMPAVEIPVEAPANVTYICNTNTGKFHYPNCSSVDQMKESNKLAVTTTRDEVIAQGYVPCKRCNP